MRKAMCGRRFWRFIFFVKEAAEGSKGRVGGKGRVKQRKRRWMVFLCGWGRGGCCEPCFEVGWLEHQEKKGAKPGKNKGTTCSLVVLIYADTAGMREPTARYSQTLKSGLVDAALSVHVPDE